MRGKQPGSETIFFPSIYPTAEFLFDLPATSGLHVNFWLWFLPVGAPALIFFVKVERSIFSHVARVVCAVFATYVLLNLALHGGRALDRLDFEACIKSSTHAPEHPETQKKCAHLVNIADGASNIFYAFFGWMPAMIYVGLWETAWRIWHRKKVRAMGRHYKGKGFSNFTISFIIIPFILYALFMIWIFFIR